MKKTLLAVLFFASLSSLNAQTETRATGDAASATAATVNQKNKTIELQSGTRLAAELQNTLDVKKARVGDEVVLRTTEAIKSQGRTVVNKGARLVGRVTEVSQRTRENGASRIGLLFDRLERGSLAMPISATITSITNTSARANMGNDDVFASSSTSSSTQARTSNPGLVGAVGGAVNSTAATVGTVAGGTTAAVGSTIDTTTNAAGSTLASTRNSLRGIQISESTSTSVSGGSTLSLQGGNLRLEKGTNFNLVVNQSAAAGTTRDQ